MRQLTGIVVLFCFVPALPSADEENPLKKSKAGDWAEYNMTGPNMEGKTRMTVTAVDDKEVTYEITGTLSFMGKEQTMKPQIQKVDLTKPYVSAANLARTGTQLETVGKGTQKLKVGDKELETNWVKMKAATTTQGITVVSEYQMWFSRSVPVSGLVRLDTSVMDTATRVDLIGFGSQEKDKDKKE